MRASSPRIAHRLGLGFFVLLLGIAGQTPALPVLAENHQALDALKKIQSAARQCTYVGTFIYQEGSQMRTSRITHVWDGENEREKLEILDGAPREFIRNNDQVTGYILDSKIIRIETRMSSDLFPSMLANSPVSLGRYYALSNGAADRVAGLPAQQLYLRPKDRWRYGYKVWTDQRSGLLLRMQTLDAENQIVEQIAFTQLSLETIAPARLEPSFANTRAWRIERIRPIPATLRGWNVKWMPPGFKKIHQIKRLVSLENVPISAGKAAVASSVASSVGSSGASDDSNLSQIVYSDGMAGISVFIEAGSAKRQEGTTREGAINIISKRYGQFWLTIVGEVPAITIKQIANSIQYKP